MNTIEDEDAKFYSELEERINIITHILGGALSIAMLALLATFSGIWGNVWHIVSFSIFGSSLIILFTASSVYHASKTPSVRSKLRIFDHAAIYVLIAGTYTPYTLVTLRGTMGWTLFGILWGIAIAGIILKIFFTGQFKILSTSIYVIMGWIIIIAIKPLANNLAPAGLFWLAASGLSYTVGAIIYSIKKIKFNHAIFHVFVLIGAICSFISIFFYVL
jgi:hemolysin III